MRKPRGCSSRAMYYFEGYEPKQDVTSTEIGHALSEATAHAICSLDGTLIKRSASLDDVRALAPGTYIIGNKKVAVR